MKATKFYPNINSLKQKLKIPQINTGKRYTHNGSPNGIVFDDIEALHAMGNIDGKVVLKSGLEMTFQQYRGQIKEYPVCNANIYRTSDNSEIFLQISRTVAFEQLLDKHPYIKLLKTIRFHDSELYINNTAIAQHYELKTPYLDLTSNFDVASFFATCEFDPIIKEYKPYYDLVEPGVIYIYNEMAHCMSEEDIKFEYLGWQGLPRPEEQKGSIYHLQINEDFTSIGGVRKHYFKHSKSTSKKIWTKFNKGKTLFPDDVAADLANECKNLFAFTDNELTIAKKRFNEWIQIDFKDEEFTKIMEKNNIYTIDKSKLDWTFLMDIKESYWINKLNETFYKTRSRMSVLV